MKIETQKDLEAVMKLCKKHGVSQIEVSGVKLLMHPDVMPQPEVASDAGPTNLNSEQSFSDEETLLWSAGNI